ncbi:DUF354 domain-containing protein [Bacteroidota bacterium]
MKYLIYIAHPAQFYLFRKISNELIKKNHDVEIVIRNKDILKDLCELSSLSYNYELPERSKSSGYLVLFGEFIKRFFALFRIIKQIHPNLLIGSEITLPLLGKVFRIPSIIFSEDDIDIIPQFGKLAYPFTNAILSPHSCDAGKWAHKKVGYHGSQKLAYLHPNSFNPDRQKVPTNKNYFVLRFSHLMAYHDRNMLGINGSVAKKIIEILEPHGDIFISSEGELAEEFKKYKLKINPLDIHHLISFADLFIGDSQSMAVESSFLGTPSIRFNDFAGKIGILEELEKKYGMTYGISTNNPEEFYAKIKEILNLKKSNEFQTRYSTLRKDKIDVIKFFIWFLENYPESFNIMKHNPNYQFNFK